MAALRGKSAFEFYRAFYSWTQLNATTTTTTTTTHGRRIVPRLATAAAAAVSNQTRGLRTWYITTAQSVRRLLDNDSALVHDIQAKYGVKVVVNRAPRPEATSWRLRLDHPLDLPMDNVRKAQEFIRALGPWSPTPQAGVPDANFKPSPSNPIMPPVGPGELDRQFKSIMRHAVANVAVLATDLNSAKAAPESDIPERHGRLRGMTVSSLTPVSMIPCPVVSFNVKQPSRTLDALLEAKVVNAYFLKPTPAGAAIAHAFTKYNQNPSAAFRDLENRGLATVTSLPRSGPKLRGEGIAARFRCLVRKHFTIGDHVVCFANVTHAQLPDDDGDDLDSLNGAFLSYSEGSYRCITASEALTVAEPAVRKLEDHVGANLTAQDEEWLSQTDKAQDDGGREAEMKAQDDDDWLNQTEEAQVGTSEEAENINEMYFRMAEYSEDDEDDGFAGQNTPEKDEGAGKK